VSDVVLALDGALGAFSAAVLAEGRETVGRAAGNDALERGISVIDGVLRDAGVTMESVTMVAVGAGPGSFTGLRIAISYAKGIALARRLPLLGVSSYDVLDDGSLAPPALAVVPGRTGIACARIRTAAARTTRCGTYDALVALAAEAVPGGDIALFGGVEDVNARLGERGFTVRAHPPPTSPALVVARLAARGGAASVHEVQPDYGELPAAVVRGGGA
jgi:tRNA threonylcarbamoyl adenosine modification protein YeaZ